MPPSLSMLNRFIIDGERIFLTAGAIHYPRIPRELWRDRILKAKAAGLNTLQLYFFWNVHEPRRRQFDFNGNADVAALPGPDRRSRACTSSSAPAPTSAPSGTAAAFRLALHQEGPGNAHLQPALSAGRRELLEPVAADLRRASDHARRQDHPVPDRERTQPRRAARPGRRNSTWTP